MRRGLAVIIPSLNEETTIAAAVASAIRAGASEIIVADGGSRDRTSERAIEAGARVLACPQMRARQMNLGAAQTRAGALLFLHADSELPSNAAAAIEAAMDQGIRFGGFRVEFAETSPRLELAARMINARTSLTRCPWGDQGQFIGREDFEMAGGFREIPLMEDYTLAVEMKRRGRTAVLPLTIRTSGRRFLKKGLLRTALINWSIITAYRLGMDPHRLARWYRG